MRNRDENLESIPNQVPDGMEALTVRKFPTRRVINLWGSNINDFQPTQVKIMRQQDEILYPWQSILAP
jgi:hypothetical protein